MALKVGDKLPLASLINAELQAVNLAEAVKGKLTVVLFFPAAFTSVCEKELCTFRDSLNRFNSMNAMVVAISVDLPFSQKAFAEKNKLAFTLLSDFNKAAIRAFGVVIPDLKGLKEVAQRAAFVADKNGIIRYVWVADNPGQEPSYEDIEKAVKGLK